MPKILHWTMAAIHSRVDFFSLIDMEIWKLPCTSVWSICRTQKDISYIMYMRCSPKVFFLPNIQNQYLYVINKIITFIIYIYIYIYIFGHVTGYHGNWNKHWNTDYQSKTAKYLYFQLYDHILYRNMWNYPHK